MDDQASLPCEESISPLLQAVVPHIQVPKDFCPDTLLFVGFSGYGGRCFCSEHHSVPRAALS